MSFETAFKKVLTAEGGYSNNPKDPGGETMYGITIRVARANGYYGAMKDLPLDVARRIYKAQYWDMLRLDSVDILADTIAEKMFDIAVNMGVAVAGRFLQRALNALNRQGSDFADMPVDGAVGPTTIAALTDYLKLRKASGDIVLYRLIDSQQAVRYMEIVEAKPTSEEFEFGWVLGRIGTGVPA